MTTLKITLDAEIAARLHEDATLRGLSPETVALEALAHWWGRDHETEIDEAIAAAFDAERMGVSGEAVIDWLQRLSLGETTPAPELRKLP
jgi:predicted transcriptional regulator